MDLKDYLREYNLSVTAFSFITKLSVPVIYKILNGENISLKSAKKIFHKTGGLVEYKKTRAYYGIDIKHKDE